MVAEQIRHRCSCGASFSATTEPPEGARRIYAMWLEAHQGPRHRRLAPGERRPRKTAEVVGDG